MSDPLICNACKQPYETIVESGITHDYCRPCQMVWFDRGELEEFCIRNKIVLSANEQNGRTLNQQCPSCSDLLTEIRQGDSVFCSCQACGGFLVASTLIDSTLPKKIKSRPMQQLDGPIGFLQLLELFLPWW